MIRKFLRRLLGDRAGSVLIEAGATLGVVTLLSLSGTELARYALLNQKLERIAASVSDLVAQAETISEGDIVNIFAAARHVAKPFEIANNGVVIISSISASAGSGVVINWQRTGAGGNPQGSRIGTPGSAPTLPAGMAVANGETVITAEVVYEYSPWLNPMLIGNKRLYHVAFFRPRFGSLTSVN